MEECEYGTDPTSFDTDNDNLTDCDEIRKFRTNPLNVDADNDGVSDGKEIERNRNRSAETESEFHVVQSTSDKDNVTASVDIELSGQQVWAAERHFLPIYEQMKKRQLEAHMNQCDDCL